jgi:hypothetical protein
MKWPAVALTLGLIIGATINGWRWDAKLRTVEAGHAEVLARIQALGLAATEQARQAERESVQTVADLDKQHNEALRYAQAEIDTARAAVAAGTRIVRVATSCPSPDGRDLPGTAAAPRVDHGGTARLDGAAVQDYFRVLDRVTLMQTQLQACQAYINQVIRGN